MKKIDIIIPAYHAQSTLPRTLASIVTQSIVKDLNVVICNDAGGDNYTDIINSFKPYVDIEEIVLPQNGGCGVARQYGIDRTKAPYFICHDADDTFAGPFALEILLLYLEEDSKRVVASGAFLEELPEMKLVKHHNDMIWMHGKLYRRAFIEKYNIRFNKTRANEDNGFNAMVRLCENENEKVVFVPDIVHYWHYKTDSITRVNNYEYTYNQSFIGYTDNMISAIKRVREVLPSSVRTEKYAVQVMAELYIQWLQTIANDERFIEQNHQYCIKYYDEIYKVIEANVPKKEIDKIFAKTLTEKAAALDGIVPEITIHQFIDSLKSKGGKANA